MTINDNLKLICGALNERFPMPEPYLDLVLPAKYMRVKEVIDYLNLVLKHAGNMECMISYESI